MVKPRQAALGRSATGGRGVAGPTESTTPQGASAASAPTDRFRAAQNTNTTASSPHIHAGRTKTGPGARIPNARSAPVTYEYPTNGSARAASALYPNAAAALPFSSMCRARSVPHPGPIAPRQRQERADGVDPRLAWVERIQRRRDRDRQQGQPDVGNPRRDRVSQRRQRPIIHRLLHHATPEATAIA